MEECGTDWWPIGIPRGNNPVKASIPSFMWTEAILRGHEMTATHDGVKCVDRLKNDEIALVLNTTDGSQAISDSREIRAVALYDHIPYFTTAAASIAAVAAMKSRAEGEISVRPLQA